MTENLNQNIPPELTDADAELLSAYLDNMLTDVERDALDARLAGDVFLQTELQAMRQTVAWLNQMPDLKAPRSFTISEEAAAQNPPNVVLMPRRNLWVTAAAAVAAVFVFVIVGLAALVPTLNKSVPNVVNSEGAGSDNAAVANEPSVTPLPTLNDGIAETGLVDITASTPSPMAFAIENSTATDENQNGVAAVEEAAEMEVPESDVARSTIAESTENVDTFAMEAADDVADADMQSDEAPTDNTSIAQSATTGQEQTPTTLAREGSIGSAESSPLPMTATLLPTQTVTASPAPTQDVQAIVVQSTREMQATLRPAMAVTGTAQAAPAQIEAVGFTATALAESQAMPTVMAETGDMALGGASNTEPPTVLFDTGDGGNLYLPPVPDEVTFFTQMRVWIYYLVLRYIEFGGFMP